MGRSLLTGSAGRAQSRGEETANAASHAVALIAALGAGYWLVSWGRSLSAEGFAGICVFVATMVWLYLASTVYHALPDGRAKRVFLRLDHGAVFLFIAGSYTAFASGHLGEPGGRFILVLVWLVAAAGMALKAMGRLSSPWLSTGAYLAMGWLVLLAAVPILERASAAGAQWLVAGGCSYTLGVVFFVLDARIRYAHAVWHGFVAAGTACHTWAVLG
ncbi:MULTISPECIES: PAQR family membrane homeostasis protein TrhA [Acidovorax]|uniref:Hemolysin III n=1 Tax=Acidovorax soli TaxID=592050 RepID=A0A1H4E699_9BURK|nr:MULTISPECIES: hemolysin III family protein [Acidovorax]SEA80347.1 hemolysin III [Acidovorax soli]